MRRLLLLLALSALACTPRAPSPDGISTPQLIGLSRMEDGIVILCDATTLAEVRRLTGDPAKAPMLMVSDPTRRRTYVGNFRGGLARIPWDGSEPDVLDIGGPSIGLALDPRHQRLAVNGAFDLELRLVDVETWTLTASTTIGDPNDPPKHSHLTHGLKSTHPYWESDGSGVVTEDNVHEVLVRVDRAGREVARISTPSAVHSLLPRSSGGWLAIGEGAVDGSAKPFIGFLGPHRFEFERLTTIPLSDGEQAKLHHADIAADGSLAVVANMGPMHGSASGQSVHAVELGTGKIRWTAQGPKNPGHVRFLDPDRVAVIGHGAGIIVVLDVRDGRLLATWTVPDAKALGHSLQLEEDGSLLVIDAGQGRIIRLLNGVVTGASASLGPGTWEASLRE